MDEVTLVTRGEEEDPSLLITIDEAARLLGMGRSYVYDAASRGALKSYRFGRAVRLKLGDVWAYREAHAIRIDDGD